MVCTFLFRDRLYSGNPQPDEAGRIRVDDWEMTPEVQELVGKRWTEVNTENLSELADFAGYQASFLRLFGLENLAALPRSEELEKVESTTGQKTISTRRMGLRV